MRWLLGTFFGLLVVFFLAPPLLSQDVFSYIAYARLDHVHNLNPYSHRPFDIPNDPVFGYAGSKDAVDVYGPIFTGLSWPLGWLSVPAAFWFLKFVAAASVGALVLIVKWIAERVEADSARAVALLGLSPATLVHVVSGAHNEALTMLILIGGVAIWLLRDDGSRERTGAFVSTLAIGVKASAAVPLPFMLAAAKRKTETFVGMLVAGVLILLAAIVGYGTDAINGLNLISNNQDRSSRWSVPHKTVDGLDQILGSIDRAAATDVVRGVMVVALGLLVLYLLRRSWKQPETWLANTGWATLGVLIASAWLVPWYLLWLLPFAAVSRDRWLVAASVVFATYTLVIAIPF
jgi:alpha-1,6-mannosyltransferase